MNEWRKVAYRFNGSTIEVAIPAADGRRVVLTGEEADAYVAAVVEVEERFFGDAGRDDEVVLAPDQEQAWNEQMDAVAREWMERINHRLAVRKQGGLT